jgi:hypothetical protein
MQLTRKYLAREREEGNFAILPAMIYHFSFILLKVLCWTLFFLLLKANERRETFNKFFACDSRLNDAFFHPKKKQSPFNKENTQKNLFRFCRDPFVKSDDDFFSHFFSRFLVKKNKYRGSLNLWTIYILCVIFFLVGDLCFVRPSVVHDDFIELVCVSFFSFSSHHR